MKAKSDHSHAKVQDRSGHGPDAHRHAAHSGGGSAAATTVKDPVCGMMVDSQAAKAHYTCGGVTYFFCCPRCMQKFADNPPAFLAPESAASPAPEAPAK